MLRGRDEPSFFHCHQRYLVPITVAFIIISENLPEIIKTVLTTIVTQPVQMIFVGKLEDLLQRSILTEKSNKQHERTTQNKQAFLSFHFNSVYKILLPRWKCFLFCATTCVFYINLNSNFQWNKPFLCNHMDCIELSCKFGSDLTIM